MFVWGGSVIPQPISQTNPLNERRTTGRFAPVAKYLQVTLC
jgi:hypothetical protein